MQSKIHSDLYSSTSNKLSCTLTGCVFAVAQTDVRPSPDGTGQTPSYRKQHPQVPVSPFRARVNQLGHDLIVDRNSTPGARISCLPRPLSTCLTTASATTYGSITAIPAPSIFSLCGAIMAVDDQVGWTHVSLISGALIFSLRSSAERPSWKARAAALVML
jgi:hypothetical protein